MKPVRIHYAWGICLGCAILYFVTCGLSGNVFPVYSPFILSEYAFSQTQISLISTVRSLFSTTAILCTAWYYMHISLRNGMLVAGLICCSGYFVFSIADSYPMFLLGAALSGIGYGIGSLSPIAMMLSRWFIKRKATATGLTAAASGLATLGTPTLLTKLIQARGIHFSFLAEAIGMTVLIVLSWLLLRNYPSDKGLQPYGAEEAPETAKVKISKIPVLTEDVLGQRYTILISLMILLCTTFNSTGFSNMTLLASTQGFPSEQVALAVSITGGMLMVGKLLFGWLSERITLRNTSLCYFACLTAGTLGLCLLGHFRWLLYPCSGLFGFSLSAFAVGLVSWVDEWFSPRLRDRMVIRFQFIYSAGALLTSVLPGILADHTGSYVPYYVLSLLCVFLCIFCFLAVYGKVYRSREDIT